jgi:hypothetical protein
MSTYTTARSLFKARSIRRQQALKERSLLAPFFLREQSIHVPGVWEIRRYVRVGGLSLGFARGHRWRHSASTAPKPPPTVHTTPARSRHHPNRRVNGDQAIPRPYVLFLGVVAVAVVFVSHLSCYYHFTCVSFYCTRLSSCLPSLHPELFIKGCTDLCEQRWEEMWLASAGVSGSSKSSFKWSYHHFAAAFKGSRALITLCRRILKALV